MRRLGPDIWSGIVMFVVSIGVGLPVLAGAVDPHLGTVPWAAAFAGVFAAIIVVVLSEPSPLQRAAYGVALVLSWVVVMGSPGPGFLPILLVVIASLGPEVISFSVNLVVVALNVLVVVATVILNTSSWADALISGVFYGLIQIATILSVQAVLREQRLRRELAEAHVDLQTASVLLETSARTAERLRIARELHDLVGHQLTVLSLELEAARHREGDEVRPHIERAGSVARSLLADVRTTVGEMRAQPASDLSAALSSIARDVPGLDVDLVVAEEVEVDDEQTAALVRAMQEIVTNALRHSGARELWVRVERDGSAVRLSAADDGHGAAEVIAGNGLTGLRERFAALGGGVDYDGRDGFRVNAWVPTR